MQIYTTTLYIARFSKYSNRTHAISCIYMCYTSQFHGGTLLHHDYPPLMLAVDDLLDILTLGPSKERLQSPLGAQRFGGPDFAIVSLVD